jgi:hypothetical protein
MIFWSATGYVLWVDGDCQTRNSGGAAQGPSQPNKKRDRGRAPSLGLVKKLISGRVAGNPRPQLLVLRHERFNSQIARAGIAAYDDGDRLTLIKQNLAEREPSETPTSGNTSVRQRKNLIHSVGRPSTE